MAGGGHPVDGDSSGGAAGGPAGAAPVTGCQAPLIAFHGDQGIIPVRQRWTNISHGIRQRHLWREVFHGSSKIASSRIPPRRPRRRAQARAHRARDLCMRSPRARRSALHRLRHARPARDRAVHLQRQGWRHPNARPSPGRPAETRARACHLPRLLPYSPLPCPCPCHRAHTRFCPWSGACAGRESDATRSALAHRAEGRSAHHQLRGEQLR